jgi:hypothetical protein
VTLGEESVETGSSKLRFRELIPARTEWQAGFRPAQISFACDETAFASEEFDNRLCALSTIRIAQGAADPGQFLSQDHVQRSAQLLYVATTANASNRASNDEKVSIVTPLSDLAQGIGLRRIRYFDSLATVEAYRHRIERHIAPIDTFEAIEADLTRADRNLSIQATPNTVCRKFQCGMSPTMWQSRHSRWNGASRF